MRTLALIKLKAKKECGTCNWRNTYIIVFLQINCRNNGSKSGYSLKH